MQLHHGHLQPGREPANLASASGNPTLSGYVAAYNILGTFAATTADNGVYVRPTASQDANLNPNSVMTELANRDMPSPRRGIMARATTSGRGFDLRFGGVYMGGVGDLIEGNYARDGYYGFNNNRDCSYQEPGLQLLDVRGQLHHHHQRLAGEPGRRRRRFVLRRRRERLRDRRGDPAPLLGGHAYFIGANVPGTNESGAVRFPTDALAGTNYIPLTQVTNGSGTLEIARYSTANRRQSS